MENNQKKPLLHYLERAFVVFVASYFVFFTTLSHLSSVGRKTDGTMEVFCISSQLGKTTLHIPVKATIADVIARAQIVGQVPFETMVLDASVAEGQTIVVPHRWNIEKSQTFSEVTSIS